VGLQESARELRSPVLLRTLRMLFSAQVPSEKDVQAILLPLKQIHTTIPQHLKTGCMKS
jgi:hypothetical protein